MIQIRFTSFEFNVETEQWVDVPIAELLANPARASAYGDAGHEIVKQLYLDSRQLADWYELLAALAQTTNAKRSASQTKLQIVRNHTSDP